MIDFLIGLAGLVLLFLPGWLLARAYRLPVPWLTALLSGPLALVTIILVLQLAGLRLAAPTLAPAWAAWTLAAWALARGAKPSIHPAATAVEARPALWPFWLVAAPMLGVIFFRTINQPLFGADTHFRWEFLAMLLHREASLWFYPPVSPASYELYAWPDGIPPLVSSIYFALYCLAGAAKPATTAPVVAVQFFVLLVATAALARRLFTPAAGGWALALLGITPLAAWAAAMGQETGFTALALVGLLLYLPADRAAETRSAMIAAGVAAAVGALAREYGVVIALFGFVLAWRRNVSVAGLAWFAAVIVATAAPWYVRNWILTGNPIFNQSFAGLFPVNEAHAALMAVYREHFSFARQFTENPFLLFRNAGAVLTLGLLGALLFRRQAGALVVAIVLMSALWIASVAYTAAGFTYSLRVLSPALAAGAVLGGAALASRLDNDRKRLLGLGLLGALGIVGAIRLLVLPDRPERRPFSEWLTVGVAPEDYKRARDESFRQIAAHIGGGRAVALGGNNVMAKRGVPAVPPWSPDAAVLFDRTLPPRAVWQKLRAAGLTHVLISRGDLNRRYLEASPALEAATAEELRIVIQNDEFVLFAIVLPAPRAQP